MLRKLKLFHLFCYLIALSSFANPVSGKEIKYLSGTDNTHTKTWEFFCTGGRKSGEWTTIQVPSCWEQQGFGNHEFGRNNFTYGKNYKYANEKGIYRLEFNVPAEWKGKEVSIVFEGSMTDTEVKINGQLAGPVHQGSFYCFKYNISDKLNYGKNNKLEVTVSKLSSDETVNRAERYGDYWNFGGIFRPVYLEASPKEHIERIAMAAKADGSFSIDVYNKNISQPRTLVAEITDLKGDVKATATSQANSGDSLITIKGNVKAPLLWTAETPNLYRVNVFLKSGKQTIDQISERIGFRTIEIRHGDGIYLNGTKIKMKGINRHCFWPETGRTLNHDINLIDVKLIREMNMNAVRCSHYPPDKDFLDICDSLGIYVIDELAGWQKAYGTEVGKKLVREMVTYDVNHPSIIFWSNGNEGGSNPELDKYFYAYDPSQRTLIRAHHKPGNAIHGIDCNHYEDYYSTSKILQDSLIYMPTEFLHCQDDGGGAAGLSDFWELMWSSKRSGGGFLWALIDEGLSRTDQNGFIDTDGVNAPDGVMGPHREKEGSFFAIKQIYSPVHITMKELPSDFNGTIDVENRFHFTNLNQCSFTYKLMNYRKPEDFQPGTELELKKDITSPSVAPTEKGQLKLKLPADWKNYDAIALSSFDPFKNEIYTWTWRISDNQKYVDQIVSFKGNSPVETNGTDSTLTMSANGVSVTISIIDGQLKRVGNGFQEPRLSFRNGPVFCGGSASVAGIKHYKDRDTYVVEVSYKGDMKYTRWKMYPSGWVSLDYEYELHGKYPYAGISFTYPEGNVINAKWLGNGPYRVWKNRPTGVTYNVWEKSYNTTQTGHYPWFYPEFKGYYSDFTWLRLGTGEGRFTIVSKDKDLYLRLFDFYGITGALPSPSLPAGDLSFLDGIPPIGTKMATGVSPNAAKNGPEGEPNEFNQTFKHTLYFYFGIPTE